MENKRFNELMAKYKDSDLSQEEYQEFLHMLREPGIEKKMNEVLDQTWKETDMNMGEDSINRQGKYSLKSRKNYWYWGVAASVIVITGLFFFLQGTPTLFKTHEVIYQTGYGEREEVILDDGSIVTLNANSKIQWSSDWSETKLREILLEGEAFFEVKKRDGIPFTVRTVDLAVEVLGTSFNVDSREAKTEVYLEEGEVNLKLLPAESEQLVDEENILMKPGDQVRYIARENKIEKEEGQTMITAAAWKNNVLNFKNMKFGEVLNLLREIYGQSFECSDSRLLSTPMYLGVPYSDWDAVRQALELSLNIEFEQKASRRYVVKNQKK